MLAAKARRAVFSSCDERPATGFQSEVSCPSRPATSLEFTDTPARAMNSGPANQGSNDTEVATFDKSRHLRLARADRMSVAASRPSTTNRSLEPPPLSRSRPKMPSVHCGQTGVRMTEVAVNRFSMTVPVNIKHEKSARAVPFTSIACRPFQGRPSPSSIQKRLGGLFSRTSRRDDFATNGSEVVPAFMQERVCQRISGSFFIAVLIVVATAGVTLLATTVVALFAASLPAILTLLFAAAVRPNRVRQHLQRLDRRNRIVALDDQLTTSWTPFSGLISNDDAQARTRM